MATIDKNRIALQLGFVFLLPPNVSLVLLSLMAVFSFGTISTRKRPGSSPIWIYCSINILFATSCLIGINAGVNEASNFLQRALVASWLAIIVFYMFDWRSEVGFQNFLRGVMTAALTNSFFVIVFALAPDLYDALQVSSFSGFDKGTRFLRSPGLIRGTDAAGYLAVIGILIYFHLGGHRMTSWTRSPLIVYIMLFSTLLCSRSSMILGGVILFLLLFFWSDRIPKSSMIGLSLIAVSGLSISGFMLIIIFMPELLNFDITTEFLGVSIESVYYLANSEDYIHQWSLSDLLTVSPTGDPATVDNLFLKTLSSTGMIGFFIAILAVSSFCMFMLTKSRKGERLFCLLYALIFVYANLKNNYFFFIPYVIVNSVLLSRFSYRPDPVRPARLAV